ncbi:MAG: hypothetical protein EAX96_16075 [Candidatus Lokiarchaeota archaeon]|nr:hypothetical protein [Candidatus Lokiarchaeota archaeon]
MILVPKSKKSQAEQVAVVEEKLEEQIVPLVKTPSRFVVERLGKGFSFNEIKRASIPIDEVKKMRLPIDNRRKTIHQENVEYLGTKFREIIKLREVEFEAIKKIEKKIKENMKNLSSKLSGLSKKEIKNLVEGGVTSVEQLADEDPKVLAKDLGEPVQKISKWIKEAKKAVVEMKYESAIAELKKIKDISRSNAKIMAALGIINLEILADEKPEDLSKDMGVNESITRSWIDEAQKILGKKPHKDIDRGAPIGKVSKKVKTEKITIDDIFNKKDVNKLKDLGIDSLEMLAEEDPIELSSIFGYNKNTILGWINEARRVLGMNPISLHKKEKKKDIEIVKSDIKLESIEEGSELVEDESIESTDILKQLMTIKGLGKTSAEKLIKDGNIKSLNEFKNADLAKLASKTGISEKKLEKFVEELNKQ